MSLSPFLKSLCYALPVSVMGGAFLALAFAVPAHAQGTNNCVTNYHGACTPRATCEGGVEKGTMRLQEGAEDCAATVGGSENIVCCVPVSGTAPATKSGGSESGAGLGLRNPLGNRTIPQLIGDIVSWLGGLAGMLFFGMMLWGGIEWMTARGDGKQVQQAQKRILNSIIGIAIILLSYVIIDTVISVPNVLVGRG